MPLYLKYSLNIINVWICCTSVCNFTNSNSIKKNRSEKYEQIKKAEMVGKHWFLVSFSSWSEYLSVFMLHSELNFNGALDIFCYTLTYKTKFLLHEVNEKNATYAWGVIQNNSLAAVLDRLNINSRFVINVFSFTKHHNRGISLKVQNTPKYIYIKPSEIRFCSA